MGQFSSAKIDELDRALKIALGLESKGFALGDFRDSPVNGISASVARLMSGS
jgi:hypothetical protein